jgi:hypothetical protein
MWSHISCALHIGDGNDNEIADHVLCMGKPSDAYKIVVGKPLRKRPYRRSMQKWDNNIKMDIIEMGWEGADWLQLE